jgi:hypothetical protein
MKLKNLERMLRRIDKNHTASGEYNYKFYSICFKDYDADSTKKYIMDISTMRCIILQTVYFDEAVEVALYLENVKLKV